MKVQASHEWPGFKPWRRQHMWVESVVGSLLCSERFFPRYSGFPLFNDQYFQIPTRLAMIGDQNHYVDVLPKNRVIFIYLNRLLYGSLI